MQSHAGKTRHIVAQVHPEFARLKEDIVARTPTVTPDTAVEKIEGIIGKLCGKPLDVVGAEKDFELDGRGLDRQKNASFKSLYKKIRTNDIDGTKVFTFCIGLRPTSKDPQKGFTLPHWAITNYPETSIGLLGPEDTGEWFKEDEHVTVTGKYHLILPKDAKPFLLAYPIQFMTLGYHDAKNGFEEIRKKLEGAGDSNAVREIDSRLSQLDINAFTQVYRHRDRNHIMALTALEIARGLGVKRVALPSLELLARPNELKQVYREAIERGDLDEVPLIKQYEALEKFLKTSKQFEIFRWDGKLD